MAIRDDQVWKFISDLFHLRYLGLRCSSVEELPVDIGKLQHLQMLDISRSGIDELLSSVTMLSHLLGLHIKCDTEMPVGMGKLISLQELTCLHVGNSQDIAKELGYLSELRVLAVVWGECDGSLEKIMVESLGNLRKLQSLSINRCLSDDRVLIMLDGWVPSLPLRTFHSEIKFPTQHCQHGLTRHRSHSSQACR
jgi:disease resistance protein RPM1